MIQNDRELHATQEHILLFERILAEARRTYSVGNYRVMAEGYLSEIDQMRAEIRDYLSRTPEQVAAA